ncbi:MAG: YggT family protein [Spirochaetaceae bacterium]|nr:MAG: YggT family protein [Spirochaetaceae bacterium]
MSSILTLISSLISLYTLIIVFRIMLTWFPGQNYGRGEMILRSATDPYLNMFRRARWMRVGYVDFSPIVALATLSITASVLTQIALAGSVTLGFILALIVSRLGYTLRFLVILLTVLTGVRAAAIAFGASSGHRVWVTMDQLLQPLSWKISRRVLPRSELTYRQGLMIVTACGVVTAVLLTLLVNVLIRALISLPV